MGVSSAGVGVAAGTGGWLDAVGGATLHVMYAYHAVVVCGFLIPLLCALFLTINEIFQDQKFRQDPVPEEEQKPARARTATYSHTVAPSQDATKTAPKT
jgi:hypothetical protein